MTSKKLGKKPQINFCRSLYANSLLRAGVKLQVSAESHQACQILGAKREPESTGADNVQDKVRIFGFLPELIADVPRLGVLCCKRRIRKI